MKMSFDTECPGIPYCGEFEECAGCALRPAPPTPEEVAQHEARHQAEMAAHAERERLDAEWLVVQRLKVIAARDYDALAEDPTREHMGDSPWKRGKG